MRGITGLSGVRDSPSSYSVTSPSKVTSSSLLLRTIDMAWAVFSTRRMSLKLGGTKRRELMQRFASW